MEPQNGLTDKISASVSETPQEPFFLRCLFFRCWHGWTWRGLIKGRFPGESVRPAVLFAQSDMQPGCRFPFLSVPQAYVLALLQSTRCSQSGESGRASLEDTWDRHGASRFTYDIGNMFECSLLDFWNWFDWGKIYYISTTVVHYHFSISISRCSGHKCQIHWCLSCHTPLKQ